MDKEILIIRHVVHCTIKKIYNQKTKVGSRKLDISKIFQPPCLQGKGPSKLGPRGRKLQVQIGSCVWYTVYTCVYMYTYICICIYIGYSTHTHIYICQYHHISTICVYIQVHHNKCHILTLRPLQPRLFALLSHLPSHLAACPAAKPLENLKGFGFEAWHGNLARILGRKSYELNKLDGKIDLSFLYSRIHGGFPVCGVGNQQISKPHHSAFAHQGVNTWSQKKIW